MVPYNKNRGDKRVSGELSPARIAPSIALIAEADTMPYNEADTRSKLIDPAIHARGWTEDLIMREVMAGGIIVVDGQPKKEAKGRADYTLRVKVHPTAQPVALGLTTWQRSHSPVLYAGIADFTGS